jgi:hypothetical protein
LEVSSFPEDACKDTLAGPPQEPILERLVRPIFGWCIAPSQAIADDMDDADIR